MDTDSNTTVLGVTSMAKTLPLVGGVLIALFVVVKPEATAGFGFVERLVFWTLHVGLGLASIALASWLLRPRLLRAAPLPLAILLTGVVGATMLAPVYVALEYLMPPGSADVADDWLDAFGTRGPLEAVVAEFIEVAPMFLAAWIAVNLPLILGRPLLADGPSSGPDDPGGSGPSSTSGTRADDDEAGAAFYALLPNALGREVIAVSSDMHYLHVHTSAGRCLVLGTLRDAARDLGDIGMLVHRSHWVAHDHVRRVARKGSSWQCVMSNGLRIPVSRRNRSKVAEWYGAAGNVISMSARKTG